MLNKIKAEMLEALDRCVGKINLQNVNELTVEKPLPFLIELYSFLHNNARFFRIMMSPKGDATFILDLKNFLKDRLYNKIMSFQPREDKMLVQGIFSSPTWLRRI